MSPLFGHREPQPAEQLATDNALAVEIDRLDSLPLVQLAAEVMVKGFGLGDAGANEDDTATVGGPNVGAGPTVSSIALEFAPGGNTRGADDQVRQRLYRLIAEGLQALEHASLVRVQMHTSMNSLDYALTRLGKAALQGGTVERALSGGGV